MNYFSLSPCTNCASNARELIRSQSSHNLRADLIWWAAFSFDRISLPNFSDATQIPRFAFANCQRWIWSKVRRSFASNWIPIPEFKRGNSWANRIARCNARRPNRIPEPRFGFALRNCRSLWLVTIYLSSCAGLHGNRITKSIAAFRSCPDFQSDFDFMMRPLQNFWPKLGFSS